MVNIIIYNIIIKQMASIFLKQEKIVAKSNASDLRKKTFFNFILTSGIWHENSSNEIE